MPNENLADHAKAMRRDPTEPEKRLWRHLSNSQLVGFKFRRQAVIGPFIADFLCPAKALIVEIDGDTHEAGRDAGRDKLLGSRGYRVLRFTNADVMRNMEGVLELITATARKTPDRWPGRPHPNPSPKGEGLAPDATPNSSLSENLLAPVATLSPSSLEEGFGVVPPDARPR